MPNSLIISEICVLKKLHIFGPLSGEKWSNRYNYS